METNFLGPEEMAEQAVRIGQKKAELSLGRMALLGVLAGSYIAMAGQLYNMVTQDLSSYMGVGFSQLVGGAVFSVGLMLVVVGGAELFTGNNLLVTVALLSGRTRWKGLLRNWGVVYMANFIGSILVVLIVYFGDLWRFNDMAWGAKALAIANAKVSLSFTAALMRGIMCNWLVTLAVWLALSAKDIVGKLVAIFFPITAFVASGFEHSVANMYFIPMGILLKSRPEVVAVAAKDVSGLGWGSFITNNLIPVTIGNIIGGAVFVGLFYWAIYLRGKSAGLSGKEQVARPNVAA